MHARVRSGKAGCSGSDVTRNLNIHDGGSARDITRLYDDSQQITFLFPLSYSLTLLFSVLKSSLFWHSSH